MEILDSADIIFQPLTVTLALGVVTIILLYWFSTRNHGYWKKRGVPYVKPVPFFGSILENLNKPINEIDFEKYRKYGSIYGYYEGNRPNLVVSDPILLRDIMIKDFASFPSRRIFKFGDEVIDKMLSNLGAEDWKRVRTIITPTFTTGKIKRMLGIFNDCSQTLVKNLKACISEGKPIEAKSIYGAFTMDVIANSAFSTKIDSLNDENNKFIQMARLCFPKKVNWAAILFLLFPGVIKFLKLLGRKSTNPLEFFKEVIHEIIEKRKETGQTGNDFLQILLDTTKELADKGKLEGTEYENDNITENYGKDDNEKIFKNTYPKKNLSFNELVSQCLVFLLAGYETTASALSLITYELALNPDVQEKLIQELDTALKENNGEMTYEAIQSIKYLDNVISEGLRKYPPALRTERMASAEYQLGDTGITVAKDMLVSIPIYSIHRDPKNYPEPEKFDPGRFSAEERAKRSPYLYLPFGAGPRNCVAMRFALVEIKVCLSHILRSFRIKKCRETQVPLVMHAGQGLMQPKEIMLQLEERNNNI